MGLCWLRTWCMLPRPSLTALLQSVPVLAIKNRNLSPANPCLWPQSLPSLHLCCPVGILALQLCLSPAALCLRHQSLPSLHLSRLVGIPACHLISLAHLVCSSHKAHAQAQATLACAVPALWSWVRPLPSAALLGRRGSLSLGRIPARIWERGLRRGCQRKGPASRL